MNLQAFLVIFVNYFWCLFMLESGNRLLSERERLRFSATDVYSELEIHKNTYRNYEMGNRDIPSSLLEKLWHMGFDIQYIVTGEYSENSGALPSMEEVNKKYGYEPPTTDITSAIKSNRRLVELKESSNLDNPADQLLVCMYHAEETLIQAGAVADKDYSYVDLANMAVAMVEQVFPKRTGNNEKADD